MSFDPSMPFFVSPSQMPNTCEWSVKADEKKLKEDIQKIKISGR
jgi:hypothetical protein